MPGIKFGLTPQLDLNMASNDTSFVLGMFVPGIVVVYDLPNTHVAPPSWLLKY